MKLPFSQREKARAAAVDAAERYPRECTHEDGSVVEFWSFVINAALRALDEREPASELEPPANPLCTVCKRRLFGEHCCACDLAAPRDAVTDPNVDPYTGRDRY